MHSSQIITNVKYKTCDLIRLSVSPTDYVYTHTNIPVFALILKKENSDKPFSKTNGN